MATDSQTITLTRVPLNDLLEYLERNNLEVTGGDPTSWPPTITVEVKKDAMPGEGRMLERSECTGHRTGQRNTRP